MTCRNFSIWYPTPFSNSYVLQTSVQLRFQVVCAQNVVVNYTPLTLLRVSLKFTLHQKTGTPFWDGWNDRPSVRPTDRPGSTLQKLATVTNIRLREFRETTILSSIAVWLRTAPKYPTLITNRCIVPEMRVGCGNGKRGEDCVNESEGLRFTCDVCW